MTVIINQYKRIDVFQCNQETHRYFKGRVTVHHVLKEKACYPQGCLYFLWRCVLLEKGQRCIQGYEYVGRKCKGCTYYADEKVHLQPRLLLKPDVYDRFLTELENYETWLDQILFKRRSLFGRIKTVKPWFEKNIQPHENHIRLRGYLLVFQKGFLGNERFEDTFYVRISENLMQEFHFIPKMKVEMTGEIRMDRGRIVVVHPGSVEIHSKGWGFPWTKEKALVAIRTATCFENQPEACLACPWGSLADIVDRSESEERRFRNLYCLKGIADPDGCYVRLESRMGRKRNMNTSNKKSVPNVSF